MSDAKRQANSKVVPPRLNASYPLRWSAANNGKCMKTSVTESDLKH
jgi:hypothetical protein